MSYTTHLDIYIRQFENLVKIVQATNKKIIKTKPDAYFINNANFLTKSFLVMTCAYLESYLKDAIMDIVNSINNKLLATGIPYNAVLWNFNLDKEFKKDDYRYEQLSISLTKKKLDDFISANPYKTQLVFNKLGIKLEDHDEFKSMRERITSLVTKRNKIVHHNDDASDISIDDVIQNIDLCKDYIEMLDRLIFAHCT